MTRTSDGGAPAQRWEDGDPDRGKGEFYQPIGVGPHPLPWPQGEHYDEALLAQGDRRNVVDKYRYWSVAAIRADLDATRVPLHVAIENWQHDLNIGSIVRTANAFNVSAVHIVGRRRWNRRGAMVTDRYMNIHHHEDAAALALWAQGAGMPIVGVDNVPGSQPLESTVLPYQCVLFFGGEGLGLSSEAINACVTIVDIAQAGSTRSMNASAAAAIALWAWRMNARL